MNTEPIIVLKRTQAKYKRYRPTYETLYYGIEEQEEYMKYRRLGKCGLKVSEIGLGCNNFGKGMGEQEPILLIRHALELGVNFLDTSDTYNEQRSEQFVGKAVKGKRHEVIIATKFGTPFWKWGGLGINSNDCGASRYHIIKAVDASLKRLDTDYIDLYYIHCPDPTTPIEETLRTMDNLVQTGKVRYIGCSNFAAWQLCEALWTSKVNNLESFVVVQSEYNLLHRDIESELVSCCEAYGIAVIPWAPLAGGALTDEYQPGKAPPPESKLRRLPQDLAAVEAKRDKLEKLRAFAVEHGHSIGELAIAWLLSHAWLSSVIAGATTPEQVSANVAAAGWRLTAQEIAQLDQPS